MNLKKILMIILSFCIIINTSCKYLSNVNNNIILNTQEVTKSNISDNKKDIITSPEVTASVNIPMQTQNVDNGNGSLYKNTEMGFTLNIPEDWKNKYIIKEYNSYVKFYYKTKSTNKMYAYLFFTIHVTDKKDFSTPTPDCPFQDEIIADMNNKVYYATYPSEEPFDMSNDEEKKEADEFIVMDNEVENILKSFKPI